MTLEQCFSDLVEKFRRGVNYYVSEAFRIFVINPQSHTDTNIDSVTLPDSVSAGSDECEESTKGEKVIDAEGYTKVIQL